MNRDSVRLPVRVGRSQHARRQGRGNRVVRLALLPALLVACGGSDQPGSGGGAGRGGSAASGSGGGGRANAGSGGAGSAGTSGSGNSSGGSKGGASGGGSAGSGGTTATGGGGSAGTSAQAGSGGAPSVTPAPDITSQDCAGKPRIGDPESVYNASLDDPAYPVMKEWAKAGVEGGIPAATDVAATVAPGDTLEQIQAKIDGAAQSGTGRPSSFKVVLIKNGRYDLDGGTRNPIITVKSGVVLRGESRDGVILAFTTSLTDPEYNFSIGMQAWAGLEKVTVTNQFVEGQPESKYLASMAGPDAVFKDNPPGTPPMPQGKGSKLSGIKLSGNAWAQGNHIVKIGTHPVFIEGAHNTMRDNVVEKAYNMADGGRGYYYIGNSASYTLAYHELVRAIRHFAFNNKVHHNVAIAISVGVDVNYHDGQPLHDNLAENVDSHVPSYHWWGKKTWGLGFQHAELKDADQNLALNFTTFEGYPSSKAYIVRRTLVPDDAMIIETPLPKGKTFYPVTGCREPPPKDM